MKLKSILIVVAFLAALSIVVYFVQRPPASETADPRLGHSLTQGAPLEQASQLRLADQGKTVTLARQSDGNWRVTNYYDFPADFKKLSAFVGSLTEAKIERLVTSNPERIARLEFKDTKIELLDNAGKELWSVTLGKTNDTGGRYARFGTEQKAYLAGFTAWLDVDAKNWADAQILDLKAEDIAAIEIPFGDNEDVKVSRKKKEDPWTSDKTPAGQQVSAAKIAGVINSTGTLRFVETTEPGDANAVAAKEHERIFKFTTFGGKAYTVALGRKPEDKKLKAAVPTPAGPGPLLAPAPTGVGADNQKATADQKPAKDATPPTPEYETITAGPVFAFVTSSDSNAPVNAMMQKRAFQISDYSFTALPQKPADLFEALPPASTPPSSTPNSPAKPANPAGQTPEPKKS